MITTPSQNGQVLVDQPLKDVGFDAVIFVHGIGEQRRYESLSELIDQLGYGATNGESLARKFAKLDRLQLNAESDLLSKPLVYQEVWRKVAVENRSDESGAERKSSVRFYEAYWAQHAADGTNFWSVLRWLFSQADKPRKVRCATWADLTHLRLGTLIELYDAEFKQKQDAGASEAALQQLEQRYDTLATIYRRFAGQGDSLEHMPESLGSGRRRSFEDFLRYLDYATEQVSDEEYDGLHALAVRWHTEHRHEQWRISWAIHLLQVTVIALGLLAFLSVLSLMISANVFVRFLWQAQGPVVLQPATFDLINLLVSVTLAIGTLGMLILARRPLVTYVGDVQQYVTYQETDRKYTRRQAILDEVTGLLRALVLDQRCRRLTIVAHSLGSQVAYDALLELGREYRVPDANLKELAKIRHFVTIGSPIDKITYFFTAIQSTIPCYVELVSELRGDLGRPPFLMYLPEQRFTWVNYWDRGDLISGPIHNIVGWKFTKQRVNNQRIVSYNLPLTSRSHFGYLKHRQIVTDLYQMIFKGAEDVEPLRTPSVEAYKPVGTVNTALQAIAQRQRPLQWIAACLVPLLLWGLVLQLVVQLWGVAVTLPLVQKLRLIWFSPPILGSLLLLAIIVTLVFVARVVLGQVNHIDPIRRDG